MLASKELEHSTASAEQAKLQRQMRDLERSCLKMKEASQATEVQVKERYPLISIDFNGSDTI